MKRGWGVGAEGCGMVALVAMVDVDECLWAVVVGVGCLVCSFTVVVVVAVVVRVYQGWMIRWMMGSCGGRGRSRQAQLSGWLVGGLAWIHGGGWVDGGFVGWLGVVRWLVHISRYLFSCTE